MSTGIISGVFNGLSANGTISGAGVSGILKGTVIGTGIATASQSFVGTAIGDVNITLTFNKNIFVGNIQGTVTIDKAKSGNATFTIPVIGSIGGTVTIELTSTVTSPTTIPPTSNIFFKFQFDKHIVASSDTNNVIPVHIVFSESPLVVSAQTVYMQVLPVTTAIFGVDFDLNNPLFPNRQYSEFTLPIGVADILTSVRIFPSFKRDLSKKIVLGLNNVVAGGGRGGATLVAGALNTTVLIPDFRLFEVINLQPTIPQQVFVETNEVVITETDNNQKLLQGFVDYNFNDNESEFWRNDVPVV